MDDVISVVFTIIGWLNPPTVFSLTDEEGVLFIRVAMCAVTGGLFALFLQKIHPKIDKPAIVLGIVSGSLFAIMIPEEHEPLLIQISIMYALFSRIVDGIAVGIAIRRILGMSTTSMKIAVAVTPQMVHYVYGVAAVVASWFTVMRFIQAITKGHAGKLFPGAFATICAVGLLLEPNSSSKILVLIAYSLFPLSLLIGLSVRGDRIVKSESE